MTANLIEHFGIVWSVLTLAIAAVGGAVGSYLLIRLEIQGLKTSVATIIERNVKADGKLAEVEAELEGRVRTVEGRVAGHDVTLGRIDERLRFMVDSQGRIEKALNGGRS